MLSGPECEVRWLSVLVLPGHPRSPGFVVDGLRHMGSCQNWGPFFGSLL